MKKITSHEKLTFLHDCLMKSIFLIQQIVLTVRKKVWEKSETGSKLTYYKDVAEVLAKKYKTSPDLETKLKSYTRSFYTDVRTSSEAYKTFVLFCAFLGVPIKSDADGNYNLSTQAIVKKLLDLQIIDQEVYDLQLAAWPVDESSDINHYACYYSQGSKAPDVALLSINHKRKFANLQFFRDEETFHEGPLTQVGSNFFINLISKSTSFVSLLSLVPSAIGQLEEINHFNGYYCSALAREKGAPVAGKVIIEKIDSEAAFNLKDTPIPDEINLELLLERLTTARASVNFHRLKDWCGVYEGFWFLFKNGELIVRQLAFQISENGTCLIKDAKNSMITGYILQASKDSPVLKCGFDLKDDNPNFRLQMSFYIGEDNRNFVDGVYSGQRENWGKIMAGKIRLYKSSKHISELDIRSFTIDNAESLLGERGKELSDFFWGSDIQLNSANFIQPTEQIFAKYFQEREIIGPQSLPNEFNENYTLFKLDSKKASVNQYALTINDGLLNYSLNIKDVKTITYSGTATYLLDCLMLNVTERNGKAYNALYIFYVGPKKSADKPFLSGVYCTTASSGSPICGRAIISFDSPKKTLYPVFIQTDDFYAMDEENHGILKFLTGVENNFIKSGRSESSLKRKIDYGAVFFVFACHERKESKRLMFLKLALDHGFNDITKLEEEVLPGKPLAFLKDNDQIFIDPHNGSDLIADVTIVDDNEVEVKYIIKKKLRRRVI